MSDFYKTSRVFVTGATGLLGSWLVKRLVEKGASVVILMRDNDPQSELVRSGFLKYVTVVNGALEDYLSLERAINEHEVDTVFHLGAQTIVATALRSPLPTFEANIRGTYNLLEACRIHKNLVKRLLIASSDKAYGSSPILPYSEEMPLMGRHPYDVSKSCTDLLAQTYYHTYHLPVVIARCGNIFGGGDLNWSRIIPGTIKSLYFGLSPEIRSDGRSTRDYIYIEDVVNAYLMLAYAAARDDVRGQAFNFGINRPYSVLEIVDVLQKLMGRTDLSPKILDNAKAEIKDQTLSSKKAEKILGWKPAFDLEKGLTLTIQWYYEYLESYEPIPKL